jgi:hypothetical protein
MVARQRGKTFCLRKWWEIKLEVVKRTHGKIRFRKESRSKGMLRKLPKMALVFLAVVIGFYCTFMIALTMIQSVQRRFFVEAAATSSDNASSSALAPLFTLTAPGLLIRAPPAPTLDNAGGSLSIKTADATTTDLRRYIVRTFDYTAASAESRMAGVSTDPFSAPAPLPPLLLSLADAQTYAQSAMPDFDPSMLTHVFPVPPPTTDGAVRSTSLSSTASRFTGFSAFLTPSQVSTLRADSSRVQWLEEDSTVHLKPMTPDSLSAAASSVRSAVTAAWVNNTATASSSSGTVSIGKPVTGSTSGSSSTVKVTVTAANSAFM